MRILISVQNYHPAYSFGGRVIKAVALAEGLHGLGHDVTVVTSSVVEREGLASPRTRRELVREINVIYLGTWLKFGQVSLNPSVLPFALSEIGRFQALHIIGLYDALGPAVALAARIKRVPYSVEPSGMLIPIVRSLGMKRAYHFLFGSSLIDGARRVVVTSEVEKRDALRFGVPEERLLVRRNGINLKASQSLPSKGGFRRMYAIPEETPLLLWLGRIEPKKNIEQLFQALSGIMNLPWTMAVVGPSESKDYLSSLRRLSCNLGIEDRLRFIPGLYNSDKLAAYADADIFVLVSINENWGNTVFEAIAAGVPVLVTDTCGVSEVVEGRAGLVVERDVASIRGGLLRMLTDGELYRKFKLQIPALASEISWDSPVRQMSDMFQRWQSSS